MTTDFERTGDSNIAIEHADMLATLKLIAAENRGGYESLWYRNTALAAIKRIESRNAHPRS